MRLGATTFGLRYLDPFAYSAAGAGLQGAITFTAGPVVVVAEPVWSAGSWTSESLEGSLHFGGGSVEIQHAGSRVAVSVGADALDVSNGAVEGAFFGATTGVAYTAPRWNAALRLQAQRNPVEEALGGGVTIAASLSDGVLLRADAGRSLRDPVFGNQGSFAVTLSLSIRAMEVTSARAPVAAVGPPEDGGRRVRLALRVPDATTVAVSGDFTGWSPRPMEHRGPVWIADVVLEPGLHHFGFVVDGQWYLPPGAPGVVADGWGNQNASLVIEP